MLQLQAESDLREMLLMTTARQGQVADWQVQNTQTAIERLFTSKLSQLVIPELMLNLVRRAALRCPALPCPALPSPALPSTLATGDHSERKERPAARRGTPDQPFLTCPLPTPGSSPRLSRARPSPARPPRRRHGAQVQYKTDVSRSLAAFGAKFATSATLQVQALQWMAEKSKQAGRGAKGPRNIAINYALTGAVRTAGSGNLQSFASYATGPYQANFMLANDRDMPESASQSGTPPPTLRLQPKINFDIDL
jgi:hypothetical protein